MKIYTLTVTNETMEEHADVQVTLYSNPEDAIKAYNEAFDEAKSEAHWYEEAWEDDEVATDTPYRWWQICDLAGNNASITIELEAKELN